MGRSGGGPDGGHFVHGEGGAVVIDDEDACATVIAEVTYRLLITPCPGICRGDPYHGGGSGSRGPRTRCFLSGACVRATLPGPVSGPKLAS
jgi:hypothetical protein